METKQFRHTTVTMLVCCLWGIAPAQGEPLVAASVESSKGVVASDHAVASQVGADVLAAGGNAADAAVGTLLALGVVNPSSSGLGGGGFCLVRPADGDVDVIDFRERAPAAARRDMYLRDGTADIALTMTGGLAVAVPGEARGLEALHRKYGKLKWNKVVRPARKLAEDGFEVEAWLPTALQAVAEKLAASPALVAEFRKDGRWVKPGETVKRPRLAKTLQLLEAGGAAAFHEGPVAAAVVEKVVAAGGIITLDDLRGYQVTWREPLHGTYRAYDIYTMPPPSSGGTTLLETLNILERYDLPTLGYNPESIHRIVEAMKHAFADRATWLGDADFVEVPTERLTSKAYADQRVVRPNATQPTTAYGRSAQVPRGGGTSHVSIVDSDGTMVACTSTINTRFGSGVYVSEYGIVLNNEMGDFTAQPGVPNNYGLMGTEQNAVAPGKRPLSSMSPTLVLKDGVPTMAVGASGGPTIITGTLLAMIRVLDWGWSAEDAVARPRVHHQWMPDQLVAEALPDSWKAVLERRGHALEIRDAYNSVQMVLRLADGKLKGVSDPRKKGRPAAVPDTKK